MTIPQLSALAREFAQAAVQARMPKRREQCLWIIETALIVEVIRQAGGNKSRAAGLLGINRNNFDYQVKKLHLESLVRAEKLARTQIELFPPKKAARSERGLRRAA